MELYCYENQFVIKCTYHEKDFPKSYGFKWDKYNKVWFTKNILKVKKIFDDLQLNVEKIENIKVKDLNINQNVIRKIKKFEEKLSLSKKAHSDLDIPCPKNLEYFPFQKAGVEWMIKTNGRCLIADDMGLGKTIQAIGYINYVEKFPVLIVCPASLKWNWEKELKKWLVKDWKIQVINGKKDKIYSDGDIYIINYDILNFYLDVLNEKNIQILIIDEIHYIKNYKAKRTQTVQKIKANHIIGLSGTPLLNRPIELWTTISLIDPQTWNSFWNYVKRYCGAEKTKYGWYMDGATNVEELGQRLRASIMLRREKREVLSELPDKVRTVIPIVLQERAESKKLEKNIKTIMKEVNNLTKEIITLKNKLKNTKNGEEKNKILKILEEKKNKQIQTKTIAFEEISKYRLEVAKDKLPYVIEFIHNYIENNGKIVVFCYHNEIFNKLKSEFKDIVVGISGKSNLDAKQRQKVIERFQNDEKIKIFLGTMRTCSEGITLTLASTVLFVEYDWTPARMIQAEDRIHRIGQKNSVNSYWFVAKDSIDEMFVEKIVEKMDVLKGVLDGENILDDILFSIEVNN